MNKREFEEKEEYTAEEVLELLSETIFQISQDLDDEFYNLKTDIAEETDPLVEAGLKRKKSQLKTDRYIVDTYFDRTRNQWRTECCDAPLKYYALNTKGVCSECGEDMPDTYESETTMKDFIKFLNHKQGEEQ